MRLKLARAYTNVLKMRANYLLRRRVIHSYPIEAYIDPAQFCNLRCPECPTGLRLKLRPAASLDLSLYKAVLDQVGDYLFFLELYNWGEPLLHKQVPEMVALAKARGIYVSISTNLSMDLGDDYLERLVGSGLDRLIVSLDGACQETYERYRRGGSFSLVCENTRRLQQMKKQLGLRTPKVVIQFLVFRHNEHEIAQMRELSRSLGADRLKLAAPVMPLDQEQLDIHPSSVAEYNMSHPENRSWQKTWKGAASSSRPCSWLYTTLVMAANGRVSGCCAVADEKHAFGDVSEGNGFLSVWNSEGFRRARALPGNSFLKTAVAGRDSAQASAIRAAEAVGPGQLICEYCPQPWLQRTGNLVPRRIVDQMLDVCLEGNSVGDQLRALVFYGLMGAPHFLHFISRGTRKLARKVLSPGRPAERAGATDVSQEETP